MVDEYVLAFRGTDDWKDWIQNLGGFGVGKLIGLSQEAAAKFLFVGLSQRFLQAASIGWSFAQMMQKLCDSQGESSRRLAGHLAEHLGATTRTTRLAVTGHSLGGGLAKIAELELEKNLGSKNVFIGGATFNAPYVADGYADMKRASTRLVNALARTDKVSNFTRWKSNTNENANSLVIDTRVLSEAADRAASASLDEMKGLEREALIALCGGRIDIARTMAVKMLKVHASAWASLIGEVYLLGPHSMQHLIEAINVPPYKTVPVESLKVSKGEVNFTAMKRQQ
jgi:hypothetical protein